MDDLNKFGNRDQTKDQRFATSKQDPPKSTHGGQRDQTEYPEPSKDKIRLKTKDLP